MWQNITLTNTTHYFKTDVSSDFFAIEADGIFQNKEQGLADQAELEMLKKLTFEFYHQKIRFYGNVRIMNRRPKAFLDKKYVAEFLYTAIFITESGRWMHTSWRGTYAIDSAPPPPFILEHELEK